MSFQFLAARAITFSSKPGDNVATGHAKFDFRDLKPVGLTSWRNVSGAGGLYSSVHDLAKWMNVQLAGGIYSGSGENAKRLFSEQRQREMWTMLTPIPVGKPSVPELAPVPVQLRFPEGKSGPAAVRRAWYPHRSCLA